MSTPDPWHTLRRHTAARIALGRTGASLPTAEWLRFSLAMAQARDAVHRLFDADALADGLIAHGFAEPLRLSSAAEDRATYLRRPDLGRRLAEASAAQLDARPRTRCDLAVVVGDGLAPQAAEQHSLPLLLELRARLEAEGVVIGLVALARQCRVALGDDVGARVGAGAVLMLLGERPGLSSL